MARERHHATERTHMEGFISGEGTRGKREAERVGGKTETGRDGERKEQREMGGGQGRFRREHSECPQEVLLVAAAQDIACQDPKGSTVQMPEY